MKKASLRNSRTESARTCSIRASCARATGLIPDRTPREREVLVQFYDATKGYAWRDNTNWRSSAPLGQWHGVTTDDDGRVVALDVHANDLSGPIPHRLSDLSRLERLHLDQNDLTGEIPAELGSLPQLTSLNLFSNDLTGEIPPELGNLRNLERLNLYINDLTGPLPDELGNLENLRVLSLRTNALSGTLPRSMLKLTNLNTLRIQENDGLCAPSDAEFREWLSGIFFDGEMCEDEVLEDVTDEVEAARNALMALYDATGGTNWTTSTNWATDKPLDEWHGVRTDRLGRVYFLDLAGNNLSGTIPREMGGLSKLRRLELEGNELTGPIPAELGELSSLVVMLLGGNGLTGSIPRELGALVSLEEMILADNNLTGPVPPELTDLTNLRLLHLDFNNLTGPLPAEFVNLTNLEHLDISRNAGLCAPTDDAFQEWLETLRGFHGDTCAGEVQPKATDAVQAAVDAAVAAGGGLRAGGHPVTIDVSALFSFGAGGSANTTYTARSSRPALVTADTTDTRLVLTPGDAADTIDGAPARVTITVTASRADDTAEVKFTVEVEAAQTPVPTASPPAQLLLAMLLLAGGARLRSKRWGRPLHS